MDAVPLLVFWGSAALLLAIHVAFPVAVLVRARVRPRPVRPLAEHHPAVTVVLAANDEAPYIADRLRNLYELDYPRDLLRVIVASDGSTDGTVEIARDVADERTTVLELPRVGKAAALNAAISQVTTPIVAFTDANTRWHPNAMRALVRPFQDPLVGGVAGEQRYEAVDRVDPVAAVEALYWAIDRRLKVAQSTAGNVTSATGAIYAMRARHIDLIPEGVTDDFFVSTGVIARGARLVYARGAVAYEPVAPSREVEFRRKVRIITRGFRSVRARQELLSPDVSGSYAYQLLFHKVLRRLSFLPMGGLLLGALLGARQGGLLYLAAGAQLTFYLAALVGVLLPRGAGGPVARPLRIASFVCLSLLASAVATWNVVRGREIHRWSHVRVGDDLSVSGPAPLVAHGVRGRRRRRLRLPPERRRSLARSVPTAVALGAGALVVLAVIDLRLAAVAGLALLAVPALRRPQLVLTLALAVLYSNAAVVAVSRHELPARVGAVIVPTLLLAVVVHRVLVRGDDVRGGLALPWMAVYLAVLVVSTIANGPSEAAATELVVFLTEGLLLYLLVVNAVRDDRDLALAMWTLVLVGSVLAALSLLQTVTLTYQHDYLGFAQHSIDDVRTFEASETAGIARVAGPIGEKNRYAQILLVLLPFAILVAHERRVAAGRWIGLVAALLLTTGVALTFSRGAAIAAVAVVLTMVALRTLRWRDVAVIVLVAAMVVVVFPRQATRLAALTTVISDGRIDVARADGAVVGRITSNLGATRVFLEHPVLGVGPGNYPEHHLAAVRDLGFRVVPDREPHNLYLQLGAESGVMGALAFGAMLAAVIRPLHRRWREVIDPAGRLVRGGLLLGLAAYLYSAAFLHLSYARYFWLLLALASVAAEPATRDDPPAQPARELVRTTA